MLCIAIFALWREGHFSVHEPSYFKPPSDLICDGFELDCDLFLKVSETCPILPIDNELISENVGPELVLVVYVFAKSIIFDSIDLCDQPGSVVIVLRKEGLTS